MRSAPSRRRNRPASPPFWTQAVSPLAGGGSIVKVSLEGWIFMVGFRVFDLGLLVLWLVWFFRLRDDGEDPPDDGGGGGGPGQGPDERDPRDGGGMRLPLGRWRGG